MSNNQLYKRHDEDFRRMLTWIDQEFRNSSELAQLRRTLFGGNFIGHRPFERGADRAVRHAVMARYAAIFGNFHVRR